jgi:hypothetical protein
MMDKFKTSKVAPKMLIADDDPCVLRAVAGLRKTTLAITAAPIPSPFRARRWLAPH